MTMRLRMTRLLASSAIAGAGAFMGSGLLATTADASTTCSGATETVCIGISENTQTSIPQVIVQGTPGSGTANLGFTDNFGFKYSATGTGNGSISLPNVLDSTTVDIENTNGTAGLATTFYLYVTETGLTSPAATQGFLSTFTVEALEGGWSVDLLTYLSATNAAFGQTTPLNSFSATGLTSGSGSNIASGLTGPYSATEVFAVTDVSGESGDEASLAINLYATPLPGTLPLFASGLAGFWAWGRRRTRGQKAGSLESAVA